MHNKLLSLFRNINNMRTKFPQIFVYKDYLSMYSIPPTLYIRRKDVNGSNSYKPATAAALEGNPDTTLYFEDTAVDGSLIYREETTEMREKRNRIVNYLRAHEEILRGAEKLMVDYVQEFKVLYPTLYFAVLPDSRGSDSKYLTAKSLIPMMDGKNKEIRIYLGLEKEFPNYKKNIKILDMAEQKMKSLLKEKMENGEFESNSSK